MSDDDIEIIERSTVDPSLAGNNDVCQLCSANFHGLSTTEREDHFNEHRSGQSIKSRSRHGRLKPASANTSQRKATPMKLGKSAKNAVSQDVFWHAGNTAPPPHNYSPRALSVLKEALKVSVRQGSVQRAVLCHDRTPHIHHESFDMSWGCGYRNFMMACAALMAQSSQEFYFPNLDAPTPPGVRNLQRWIEDAWEKGYDDIGARELDRKLVDTKKKIGTGDLYAAFTSRKIPCELVDFDMNKCHKGFDALIDWIVKYFAEKPEGDVNQILLRTKSPVVATSKMPVILQYDGHSVTIVGYEIGKNGKRNLLVFDPSSKVKKEIRQAALSELADVNWTSLPSISLGKNKRRERSKSPVTKKRSRADKDPEDDVVSMPDSDDEQEADDECQAVPAEFTLDPDTVVKAFRYKRTKRKSDYQLLYFTMDDPLSDQEQNSRKVVFSVSQR